MHNYLDLTGKVALITGASSGIGAATAAVFADLGAHVAIGYHKNRQGAEDVCHKIAATGAKVGAIQADMRKSAEIARMVESAVEQLGPIDILVNNAGSLVARISITKITEEGWDDIIDLNLKSAALCSKAVAASMIE